MAAEEEARRGGFDERSRGRARRGDRRERGGIGSRERRDRREREAGARCGQLSLYASRAPLPASPCRLARRGGPTDPLRDPRPRPLEPASHLSPISFRSARIFFSSSPSPSRDRSEELAVPRVLSLALAPCSTKCPLPSTRALFDEMPRRSQGASRASERPLPSPRALFDEIPSRSPRALCGHRRGTPRPSRPVRRNFEPIAQGAPRATERDRSIVEASRGIPVVFSLEKPKVKLLPFKISATEEENPLVYQSLVVIKAGRCGIL
ncbi:uncharacterized protein LOC109717857 isoform X2 [Ananas comosus]|uniref:Uncharacterized protein LOC109717857 isoform X2 n=1 Tax=Ananas comosus TaxID=4615 RepID=A0A6P5FSY5_ANACO|nr:uncharacterized protein LOC109717857 isoform X2 [Ananas comosus]